MFFKKEFYRYLLTAGGNSVGCTTVAFNLIVNGNFLILVADEVLSSSHRNCSKS